MVAGVQIVLSARRRLEHGIIEKFQLGWSFREISGPFHVLM